MKQYPDSYQPETIPDLIDVWKSDIARLNDGDTKNVAYDMVQRLASSKHWDEWSQIPLIGETFELAAQLELPIDISEFDDAKSQKEAWGKIKQNLTLLEQLYIK